jgi:hypothetical protein
MLTLLGWGKGGGGKGRDGRHQFIGRFLARTSDRYNVKTKILE